MTYPITAPVDEMARISGLGTSAIWSMIKDGRLETVAIGRRRLVIVESYRRYVAELHAGAPKSAKRNNTQPPPGKGRKCRNTAVAAAERRARPAS